MISFWLLTSLFFMLHLEIVTPEKKIFSDTVDDVYLPGTEGEMGILELHAALVTSLAPGELRYSQKGKTTELAIGSGFAEVSDDKLTVLTDQALGEEDIDEEATQEAIERAQKALEGVSKDDIEEQQHLQNVIAANLASLKLRRKRRG